MKRRNNNSKKEYKPKKRKRMSFRNKMQADYYGNTAIRTKYEFLFQGFLDEAKIPYLVNQVFCFECNRFFPFENMGIPECCYYCRVSFKQPDKKTGEKGHLSRPDFLLNFNEYPLLSLKKLGVIRIDGAVHDLKKATRITDYHILNAFKELGIKVFIIKNETLLEKSVAEIKELATSIKLMMEDDDLYLKYTKSKEYEENTYCPDIQIRKIRRK